jgi:hypothetical protein
VACPDAVTPENIFSNDGHCFQLRNGKAAAREGKPEDELHIFIMENTMVKGSGRAMLC